MSPLLFLITLDDVMERVKNANPTAGIQWKISDKLLDLDYADDICILTHRWSEMNKVVNDLHVFGQESGLAINFTKTEEIRMNNTNNAPVQIGDEQIKRTHKTLYLGAVIADSGGTQDDVKNRINRARTAFAILNPVWKSSLLSNTIKIRIFRTNVLSVLLYASESWLMSQTIASKIQVFVNRCLRRIFKIFWPRIISNKDLWDRAKLAPVSTLIKKRKWGWIGHILRQDDTIARVALEWNPQGTRRRGRPTNTWRRTVNDELSRAGFTWTEIKVTARNRVRWRRVAEALYS